MSVRHVGTGIHAFRYVGRTLRHHLGCARHGRRPIAGAARRATRARLLRRYPDARESPPPSHIRQIIEGIVGLLRGESRDFSSRHARHRGRAAVPPAGLCGRAHHSRRQHALLWRHRKAARRRQRRARRRRGDGQEPIPDHRAVPPRARSRRQGRWLLRGRRHHHQAAPAPESRARRWARRQRCSTACR